MAQLSKDMNISENEVLAWASDLAQEMTDAENSLKTNVTLSLSNYAKIPVNSQNSFNVGYLPLQKIYYQLGLDSITSSISLDTKAEFDINAILRDLVLTRILFFGSKRASFDLADKFIGDKEYSLHHV